MDTNYHAHTWRCMHAAGTEREYVEAAIGHYRIFGFSDHTPQPYPGSYESNAKMHMDQVEDYVDTILDLKKEYKEDLEIHVGLEVEYYPNLYPELMDYLSDFPLEYFILGQHCLGNEINEPYVGNVTKDVRVLERYCKQCIEALQTGCFTYLAHPDLVHFVGDPAQYEKWMRYLCRETKKMNIPLEINLLGIRDHRHYPKMSFWKIASEEGCPVVLGADSHDAAGVWDAYGLSIATRMVEELHLHLLTELELVVPIRAYKRQ